MRASKGLVYKTFKKREGEEEASTASLSLSVDYASNAPPRAEDEEENVAPFSFLFFFFPPTRAGRGSSTRIRMSPNSRQSSGLPPRTAERQSPDLISFSPSSPPPSFPLERVLTTTGLTSRTRAERSHAYLRSPGHSAVAPLKLGSFRLSLGPAKAPLLVAALRGSAGSSRLQMNLPFPSELFVAPALPLPPRFHRLFQRPPPPLLLSSSFETTTTDPFSSLGCHQQEREERRPEREEEEEEAAPEGCEKSNAALEDGDAGDVLTEEEEDENAAEAEGSPQCRLPCARASPWLTSTRAAHAAETGGSHAMPASATSSSKGPQGESS